MLDTRSRAVIRSRLVAAVAGVQDGDCLCESPAAVDRVHRELVDAGAQALEEPWDAFWGQRYAEVGDPDGNVIDVFAPLES